jgi:hypothetical protein
MASYFWDCLIYMNIVWINPAKHQTSFSYDEHQTSLHSTVCMDKHTKHVRVLLALLLMYFAARAHCKWQIVNQVIVILVLICMHISVAHNVLVLRLCFFSFQMIVFVLLLIN